jgi:putative tricarboxylic transport membrane protein
MKNFLTRQLVFWCAVSAIVFVSVGSSTAIADWKPARELLLVTHSSPGAGNDLMLRNYISIWEKNDLLPPGIKAKVSNVRGGGGAKARNFVAKINKGNDHLLWSYTPTQLIRPLIRKSEINHKSFTNVALTAIDTFVVVVHSSSPYKKMDDLVAAIKKNPGKIRQGGGPFGNSSSIAGVQLKKGYGLEFTYTPYKGGGDAVLQLLGQHIDFIIENPSEMAEHVKAGKLRMLAATEKLTNFPDVPTFKEAGYPFRTMSPFYGVMMPPEVSNTAVDYYIGLLKRTQQTQEWANYLRKNDLNEIFIAGKNMATWVDREAAERSKILKSLGLFKRSKKKK